MGTKMASLNQLHPCFLNRNDKLFIKEDYKSKEEVYGHFFIN